MNLTIRYFDRETNKQHAIEIPNDLVEITIPENPDNDLPSLKVHINPDAIAVDRASDDTRVSLYLLIDAHAEATSDIF
jgi:hypothetical protein